MNDKASLIVVLILFAAAGVLHKVNADRRAENQTRQMTNQECFESGVNHAIGKFTMLQAWQKFGHTNYDWDVQCEIVRKELNVKPNVIILNEKAEKTNE